MDKHWEAKVFYYCKLKDEACDDDIHEYGKHIPPNCDDCLETVEPCDCHSKGGVE